MVSELSTSRNACTPTVGVGVLIASAETAVVKRADVNKAVAIFMVKTHFKLKI